MRLYACVASALLGVLLVGVDQASAWRGCCRSQQAAPAPGRVPGKPSPDPGPGHAHPAPAQQATQTKQVTIAVSGMTWTSCAARVQKALAALPWVRHAQVDFAKKQAVVIAEADKYDEQALLQTLEKAGYGGKVVK